ncbi:MAG: hypothetical protein AAF414_13505 [Pseudomonadota bacterium]
MTRNSFARALLFVAPMTVVATVAIAQPTDFAMCPERRHVLTLMAERFEQSPIAMGLARNGDLLELLTNPMNGDWTILATSPDGRSCQLAAGTAWQEVSPAPLVEPDA